jgi:transposase-like protein
MHNRKHQISTSATPEDASEPSPIEAPRPDPEVVAVAKRRTFSKAEKLRILGAADACVAPGEVGALLRREGIYSSHLATWRKQRQSSGETGSLARKRGPKTDSAAAQERRVLELEKQVERLQAKLVKADLIIDVQKKLSILLGLSTDDTPSEPK